MAKKKNNTEEVAASVDAVTTSAPVEQVVDETVVDETVETEETETEETETEETETEETEIEIEETETEIPAPTTKYRFTKNAPKSIRYNGEVYSQEEVLTNEDLLAELVHGKCI